MNGAPHDRATRPLALGVLGLVGIVGELALVDPIHECSTCPKR